MGDHVTILTIEQKHMGSNHQNYDLFINYILETVGICEKCKTAAPAKEIKQDRPAGQRCESARPVR